MNIAYLETIQWRHGCDVSLEQNCEYITWKDLKMRSLGNVKPQGKKINDCRNVKFDPI